MIRARDYISRIKERGELDKGVARRLTDLCKSAALSPKRLTKPNFDVLVRNTAKTAPPERMALSDMRLRAMVNLGLVHFELLPLKSGLPEIREKKSVPPVFPNLFTEFRSFKPAPASGLFASPQRCPPVFLAEASYRDFLGAALPEFLRAGFSEGRSKAVIVPSDEFGHAVCERCEALGYKTSRAFGAAERSSQKLWKLLTAASAGNGKVLVGTKGLAPLIAHIQSVDVLVFDVSSPAYTPDTSTPEILSTLCSALEKSGALFVHRFTGAGLRAAAIPPAHASANIETFQISRWSPAEKSPAAQLPNLTVELAKTSRSILLVYNRLGKTGGFACTNCGESVNCPKCDGMLHYALGGFACSNCDFRSAQAVCPECAGEELASITEGADTVAEKLINLLGRSKVACITAAGTNDADVSGAKVVVATDVCLYRKIPVDPDAIIIAGIEDKILRNDLSGPEAAADYVASICGIYAGKETRITVAEMTGHDFYGWISGKNPKYFKKRLELAEKLGLPPFSPRFVIRSRSDSDELARSFFAALRKELAVIEISEEKKIRRESSIQKVFEAVCYSPVTYEKRRRIVEIARSNKVAAIPYVIRF